MADRITTMADVIAMADGYCHIGWRGVADVIAI